MRKALISCIGVLALLVVPGAANATPFPGPDAAGYTGTSIPNNLRDISSSGTQLILGDDQVSGFVPLGFNFNFYGTSYNQARVSSNGFLTFNDSNADGCCTPPPLPTASAPSNLVAGLWADLFPPLGGNVRYQTLGVPGSLEFVVGFYGVIFCCDDTTLDNTFEMILHEVSNDIELQYGSTAPAGTVSSGIENDGGTIGLQIYNGPGGTTTLQNQGFLISQNQSVPEPSTLSVIGLGILGLGAMRKRRRHI